MRMLARIDRWLPVVLILGGVAVLTAQSPIEKVPEFEDPKAFRSGAPAGTEASSHVSARTEKVSLNLLRHLAAFDIIAQDEEERRLFRKGYGLVQQRLLAAAVSAFRAGEKRFPESEPISGGIVVALFMTADYDASASLLLRLAGRSPGNLRLLPLIGETAGASERYKSAMAALLRDFVHRAPASGAARYYLAQFLSGDSSEAPAQAIALWTDAARLDPRDARPCLELARVEASRADTSAAIRWLNRALERDPDLAEAHYRLAHLYLRIGQRKLSDEHMQRFRALRVKP